MEPIDDRIMVTGGAGYIGSHTVIELIEAGYTPIVVDNLSNSSLESLKRVEEITGKEVEFHNVDILDEKALDEIFETRNISSVIHFAGLKAVGESNKIPLKYYNNNITGTLNLLNLMDKHRVKKIVFSSSATVYGDPHTVPITEEFPLSATNPYGRTKLYVEGVLQDLAASDPEWSCILLRYFNPVGAHPSGKIGEDPKDIPNNLMPYVTQTAIGKREVLSIFGNDYNTHDGTGVRDYIHVVDLAKGHIAALRQIHNKKGCVAYNLGTGHGYSVLDMVEALKKASHRDIPYQFVSRRKGDVGSCFADPSKALKELNWKATHNQDDMCRDAWNWQSQNPNGYRD
ncbi:UDP-glucose 4-epimerase [Dictyostelium purpureum]|uniref:UDP-glucose 4-epimerase n=1 Tax=Dictyostelium purpureum TaxID=5786 RepID=F0ZIZ0_DICPU|nr:UDP-glucose 4-epimerase [Dictyostelium purpureum]EGC36079.1 UDP-glucose 4-epimerase [Dictyostelium purpureum]|eukprot:XP_003287397.1 UDP-glucose 4-epimerase [Dictyostelium purpureum]